ncbi:hypothetical protein KQI86_14430 [Clostridium sp. MSJ-11]|uniref:Uncharacterized protein n=1 Tax=Clostridium mobile TaxID=2841512 RepID=A0ABS6EM52_9CLOT|nr:hypothetical protein [Clostridium mobile]MBU5485515.1 hypothetical protein [Clostridium mobile]
MKVCPLCNKLDSIDYYCIICHGVMVDKGRVEEYIDPYGPQLPIMDNEDGCLHLYECSICNKLERKRIDKVNM